MLAIVHNITAATRLLDVLGDLASDLRIQVRYTIIGSSTFTAGSQRFLTEHGINPIPWRKAVKGSFDLAIAASHGGPLSDINVPLAILPHGMGYNKLLKPETGNRKPETGNRKPETGNRFSDCRLNGCSTVTG